MKELYEAPESEIIILAREDVITTSGNGNETAFDKDKGAQTDKGAQGVSSFSEIIKVDGIGDSITSNS